MLTNGDNVLSDLASIASHTVTFFENLFSSNSLLMQGNNLVDSTIPSLVDEATNRIITTIPSLEEISAAVFNLNGDDASGPDGFGAVFFQKYWDIVKHDVSNAVIQFFTTGWILPGFNTNAIILIPKIKGADSLELFRPIAVSNFKFKIISKVLADRLASIMPVLVLQEQRGFIHGRHIHECIGLASEAINLLDSKSWCGNIALKVDISKAFDTLDWNFLISVLQKFGFNSTFCSWIHSILCSAHLSVTVNGVLNDYFSCSRGIRRGQYVNCSKSFIFGGAMYSLRLNILSAMVGFKLGSLPFVYLGVPLFKGKPKAVFLCPIEDKVISKLASWKGSFLSFAGRVELVKSAVQSMLLHSMVIYDWPISLIRDIERAIKRFIWSSEVSKNKVIIVTWNSVCLPLVEGGLGIRSIANLNAAFKLKLAWDFFQSNSSWTVLLRQRVFHKGKIISHHIFSSIWSSLKSEMHNIEENFSWCLGDGATIMLWSDKWCGESLQLGMDDPSAIVDQPVRSLIVNGCWDFTKSVTPIPAHLHLRIRDYSIPSIPMPDAIVWPTSPNGDLSLKASFEFKRIKGIRKVWWRWIWSKSIPPSKSVLMWKLIHNKLWMWLGNNLNFRSPVRDWSTICDIMVMKTSGQCRTTWIVAVIFTIDAIWKSQNKVRFQSINPNFSSSISGILSSVSIAGSGATASFINMQDFILLKNFGITIRPPKEPNIIEVIWTPPPTNWIKFNCDEAASSSISACGGIARNSEGGVLAAFAIRLDSSNSLIANLTGAMFAI
ncbi:uncharacterized protein LOC131649564 [Vicia villosa]|uniref:uncharacterized protein LOC131649564 n=1 Tax=Vicia villosa TaxID=3911 RepID=UPI00273CBE5F|nr:uncharacterized protein LOC131649564 [Vicia villosa]